MNAAAREVLGVSEDATEANIQKAYRKKVVSVHPNKGGTHENMLTVTSARDYLTGDELEFKNYRPGAKQPGAEGAAGTSGKTKPTRTQTRKKKDIPLPKKPTTVEEWLDAKVTHPRKFTVDENGDLVVPPYKAGEAQVTIVHRAKAPATTPALQRFFGSRRDALKEAEAEFAAAKRASQEAFQNYKREAIDVSEYLAANKKTNDAQIKLNALVKFPRDFITIKGLLVNDLNFDWYRRTKIPVPVGSMQPTTFPWQAFWTEAPDQVPEVTEDMFDEEEEDQKGGAKPKRELTAQQRAIIANYRKKRMGGF